MSSGLILVFTFSEAQNKSSLCQAAVVLRIWKFTGAGLGAGAMPFP
jgi:hypothetical protein